MILILIFISIIQNSSVYVQILDEDTKLPIPYVSYTRLSDHKGSFADEEGNIEFKNELTERYILSCVGYKPDTIIPSNSAKHIFLKPIFHDLSEFEVVSKRSSIKVDEIGYLGGFSLSPHYASIPRKMQVCTFIPNTDREHERVIKAIKIDIGGNKSKVYDSFVIRLFIKDNSRKLPGRDLLTKDLVVRVKANTYKYTFELEELLILPENGCFVGFETVGKIDKKNNFIAFSDFYSKPEKPFQFIVRLVKSNTFSLVKYSGSDSWISYSRADSRPDTYAIGLDVSSGENP